MNHEKENLFDLLPINSVDPIESVHKHSNGKLYFDNGKMKFLGYEDLDKNPEFFRYKIDHDAPENCEDLRRKVLEVYQSMKMNPEPKLFISVIGGFKRMNITKQQRISFKQGLINIMKKNRTLILTGGFNVGIHKLVSESVREYQNSYKYNTKHVTLIGICTWGVVLNKNSLENQKNSNALFEYPNTTSNVPHQVALDPNCDYLVFCDDGSEFKYDREVNFKSIFEMHAQQKGMLAVQLLFEGGFRAIVSAHRILHNGISIVVINHSGRAADLISEVLYKSKNSLDDQTLESQIKTIVDKYKDFKTDERSQIMNLLKDMVQLYQDQIFIYDMANYRMKLDDLILEAVIAGQKSHEPAKLLELSIQFNCFNVAAKYLKTEYSKISDDNIKSGFLQVLIENKYEFVQYFLEKDYPYESIITTENLTGLYQVDCSTNVDLSKVGKSISKLSGRILNNPYTKKAHKEKYRFQDLFLWALLCSRMELAKIFWENGTNHVSSALIGSIILKNKASTIIKKGDSEQQKRLMNESLNFENLALKLLTKAFEVNQGQTVKILKRQLKLWNNTSCFDIALSGQLLNFLNHSACTSYTTLVWMGELSPLLPTWKILVNIPFSCCLMSHLVRPYFRGKSIKVNDQKGVIDDGNRINESMEDGIHGSRLSTFHNQSKPSTFYKSIKMFYSAAVVKFYIVFASYVTFLFFFAYLNLVELKPWREINGCKDVLAEIFVYIYILSFIIEEIRQIYDQNVKGCFYKWKAYFSGSCNRQDVVIITFVVISIMVRFLIRDDIFMICRCMYNICFCMFCLRTLQFYFAFEFLGPKVVMIGEMIRDISFFVSIFGLFILSFGTLSQSMRSPNSHLNITLLNDVFRLPYFQSYGEIMLEKVLDDDECYTVSCYVKYTTIILALALYLLLTNILLVNLLIAMFGYTFNTIHSDSRKYWSFIRFQLVKEFHYRSRLPPPFSMLSYPCKRDRIMAIDCNPFLKQLELKDDLEITNFEKICMEEEVIDTGQSSSINDAKDSNLTRQTESYRQRKIDDLHIACVKILDTLQSISDFQITCERRLERLENIHKQ